MEDSIFLRRISLARTPEDYTAALPVVRALQKSGGLSFSVPVTFFVGENGSGKSTLLEAIAVASGFNPEGGSRNFCFSTNETHAALAEELHLVRGPRRARDGYFLRAESFYNAASYLDELDEIPAYAPHLLDAYGGKSLHEQSHGESFFSLLLHRFAGGGLYLLDEPEAAFTAKAVCVSLAFARAGARRLAIPDRDPLPHFERLPERGDFCSVGTGHSKDALPANRPPILTREF